ncbi:MAG: hypothetical protein IMZ61_12710 [Planctomycetes bacterium]|nr:hypothetical protein [Planctomycetota bacterium]
MRQEEELKQAITLIKAGNKSEAIPILKTIIKTDRNNEGAWLWMSTCADRREDKIYCFHEAMRINPNNENAKKALSKLEESTEPIFKESAPSITSTTTQSVALVSAPKQENKKDAKLVCPNPKCRQQSMFAASNQQSINNFLCPSCNAKFTTRIVKIRTKNSRSPRNSAVRSYSIRIYDLSGKEDLIKFDNANKEDFELRSKDIAAFTYLNDQLTIVQNLTIGHYIEVSKPKCYLATYIYGEDSIEVCTLRSFRDNVLLTSKITTKLVDIYYHISPKLIEIFGKSGFFYFGTKSFLTPIIWFINQKK